MLNEILALVVAVLGIVGVWAIIVKPSVRIPRISMELLIKRVAVTLMVLAQFAIAAFLLFLAQTFINAGVNSGGAIALVISAVLVIVTVVLTIVKAEEVGIIW